MAGITAYSAYIPWFRLPRKTISQATGWLGQATAIRGEKAVANFDEDSITMAVAASMNCLRETGHAELDGLYFATTSAPYRERESASIIATALNIGSNIRSADFTNSLKSGMVALLAASEAVAAGGAGNILVCGADTRIGQAGGNAEMIFGDGGAAFVVGKESTVADLAGSFCKSYDFPDHWRSAFDKYDRSLEDRLIRDEAYSRFIPQALGGLMKKYNLETKKIAKVVYPCLYARDFAGIANELGFDAKQIQNPLLETMGDAGTASSLLMLVAALDEAQPGDNILAAGYGNGCAALWFKVTPEIEKVRRGTLKEYLENKEELNNYEKYAAFRRMLPMDVGMRGEVGPTFMPVVWREREFVLGLVGSRCTRCGTPQLPPQHICANPACGAIDEMEPYRFSDKKGILFSYTEDNLAFVLNRPQMYGMIDFDGGGRYLFDITDCKSGTLKVEMPMELTLRRKYYDEVRGIHGYFWKAMPIRIRQGGQNDGKY